MICKLKLDGSGGFSGISNTVLLVLAVINTSHIVVSTFWSCSFLLPHYKLMIAMYASVCRCKHSSVATKCTKLLNTRTIVYYAQKRMTICYHFMILLLVSTLPLWVTCLILWGRTAKHRSRLCRRQYWFRLQLLIQLI